MITPRAVRAGSVVLRAALFPVVAFVISACSSSGSGDTGNTSDDGTGEGGGSYAGSSSGSIPTTAGRALQEADGTCPAAPAGASVGLATGNQLEELVVQSCDGKTVSLAKLCGNKATWLYLVHGWCPHVKAVSTFAESLHQSLASRGLHSVHVMVENGDRRAPTAEDCAAWKERWGLEGVELYFDQTGRAKGLMTSEYTSVSSFLDKSLVITDKTHIDDQPGLRSKLETLLFALSFGGRPAAAGGRGTGFGGPFSGRGETSSSAPRDECRNRALWCAARELQAALSAENDAMTTAETTEQSKPTEPLAAASDAQSSAVSSDAASPDAASPDAAAGSPAGGAAGGASTKSDDAASHGSAESGDADGDDEGDDAPEGEAGATAEGAATGPTGEKKKRRRRRKKKGGAAGAEGAVAGAPAAAGEGGEAGAEAKPGEGGEGKAGGPKGDRRKKNDKPREPRERPAFHVGELVFGRILDINEDAVLIDLAGKGLALFDRLEEAIVDEPATPAEARAAAAEAAAEDREHGDAPPAEAAAPAEAPTEGEALAAAAEAPAADASAAAEASAAEASAAEAAPEGGAEGTAAAEGVEAAPKEEVKEAAPLPPIVLEVGANFVGYIHNDGGRGGLVVVTRHPKRASKIKPVVAQAVKDRVLVKGLVTGVIKGGLEVDVEGLRAFAPASHVDLRPGADLTPLLARRLDFYVTQYGKRGRDVVLSRKPMLETEAKASREAALAKLAVGSIVPGTVRSVVQFGAFIDLGGIEGLVPLSEMSHNRSEGPSDVFKPGQSVDVKILKVDDRGKVWLSRKATLADPWMEVAKKYATGTRHNGKVVRIQPFGAFVELEPGIDGLIHVADLSTKRIESPEEVVKVGDTLDVVVSHVDASAHRIALHPAPSGDTAGEQSQRVQLYKPVKVVVVTAEAGGLGVRIKGVTGRQSRGFITAAATGTARGTELRKLFPPGIELDAKVMEMDPKRGEIKLSIKALTEQTERDAYQQYRQTVARDAKFTFADLVARKGNQR